MAIVRETRGPRLNVSRAGTGAACVTHTNNPPSGVTPDNKLLPQPRRKPRLGGASAFPGAGVPRGPPSRAWRDERTRFGPVDRVPAEGRRSGLVALPDLDM